MRCGDFSHVVSDLVRGQVLEVRRRDGALDHVVACEFCRARLRDERRLSSDLRALAEAAEPLQAQSEVENRLLEAFGSRLKNERRLSSNLRMLAQATRPLEARSEVEALVLKAFRSRRSIARFPRKEPRKKYWAATWAAAAIVLLAVSLLAIVWSHTFPTNKKIASTPADRPPMPPTQAANEPNLPPQSRSKNRLRMNLVANKPRTVPTSAAINSNAAREQSSPPTKANLNNEIATDFFPIGDTSALSLADGGQLVRIQMPRSTLMKFGLPVTADQANERVKADVLLGADGIARAIRFVK